MTDSASLQNLHEIVPPPQAGLWPLAPGWYLLAGVIVFMAVKMFFTFLRHQKANRYRKTALEHLERLRSEMHNDKGRVLQELPLLVKSVALQAYPRPEIAGLHGKSWLGMLDTTLGSTGFTTGPGQLLPRLSYQSPKELEKIDPKEIDELTDLIKHWIQHHRPLQHLKKEVDNV